MDGKGRGGAGGVIERKGEAAGLVPDPEETVPRAGGYGHAVVCHP